MASTAPHRSKPVTEGKKKKDHNHHKTDEVLASTKGKVKVTNMTLTPTLLHFTVAGRSLPGFLQELLIKCGLIFIQSRVGTSRKWLKR